MIHTEGNPSRYILSASHPAAPAGAALIQDGMVVGGIREEYLSRHKGERRVFPDKSAAYVLGMNGIQMGQVDHIAIGSESTQDQKLESLELPVYSFISRHKAEAQLTLHTSKFADKPTLIAVLGLEAEAGITSTLWQSILGEEIRPIARFSAPYSVEHFYSSALGVIRKEYGEFGDFAKKIKAAAPINTQEMDIVHSIRNKFDEVFHFDEEAENFSGTGNLTQEIEALLETYSSDESAVVTRMYEYAVYTKVVDSIHKVISTYRQRHGLDYVCMGGDFATSSHLNTSLYQSGTVDRDKLSVTPFPGGEASYIGAGIVVAKEVYQREIPRLTTVFLGKHYTDERVREDLEAGEFPYIHYEDFANLSSDVADLIAAGNTVAWFQGAAELGPRALGNRNILSNLADPEGATRLNTGKKTKPDKPVAIALTEAAAAQILVDPFPSPYMSYNFTPTEDALTRWPHLARDIRPHIVSWEQNPRYWQLLNDLKRRTGIAGAYKSSFNVSGHVPAESPSDALAIFKNLEGIEYLVIGNFLISRNHEIV